VADESVRVSVVFPCLDEAGAIASCVAEAVRQLHASGISGEVIVADNGSTDGSAELAQGAGARVVHEIHAGYGAAIVAGVSAARGQLIVVADADDSYDLAALAPMVQALEDGAELVLGNRFRGTIDPGAMPWGHRRIGNPMVSLLLRVLFGNDLSDAMCGLRAFSRDAYERMRLQTTGMEFASEMIARASRAKMRIAEVPVHYRMRVGRSKLRPYRDGWRHVRFLLMYSPTWLYLIPSGILTPLGLTLLVALASTPIEAFGRRWDMHLAAVASLLTLLGAQIAWLGISARTLAVLFGFTQDDPLIRGFYRRFRLETGLVAAAIVMALGLAISIAVFWSWASRGFPALDEIRPLLLSVTLVTLGAQTGFNVFFLSLLGVRTRRSIDNR